MSLQDIRGTVCVWMYTQLLYSDYTGAALALIEKRSFWDLH